MSTSAKALTVRHWIVAGVIVVAAVVAVFVAANIQASKQAEQARERGQEGLAQFHAIIDEFNAGIRAQSCVTSLPLFDYGRDIKSVEFCFESEGLPVPKGLEGED